MKAKLILTFATLLAIGACSPKIDSTVPAKVVDGMIEVAEAQFDREVPGLDGTGELLGRFVQHVLALGDGGAGGEGEHDGEQRHVQRQRDVVAVIPAAEQIICA